MDAANLDTARKPRLHLLSPDRSERVFAEDKASRSVRPSIAQRIFRAYARFLFAVLVGVSATLAWQSYGDQGKMDMIRAWTPGLAELLPGSTGKPAVSLPAAADVEQLKPIATDLAAVRYTLEQLTATLEQLTANQDQLTRTQQQIAKSVAALQATEQELTQKLSSPPPAKPVHVLPPPKPAQHPAQPPTQASSNPLPVPPPQSLQPQQR
jgi:hypothetical protein